MKSIFCIYLIAALLRTCFLSNLNMSLLSTMRKNSCYQFQSYSQVSWKEKREKTGKKK